MLSVGFRGDAQFGGEWSGGRVRWVGEWWSEGRVRWVKWVR